MKISEKTLTILKNFVSIDKSLLFDKGNVLRTISRDESIYAIANVEETFPKEFGVYELKRFLDVVGSLYKEPELDFSNDNYVTIKEGNHVSKYYFTDKNFIKSPNKNKKPREIESDVEFQLEHSVLEKLIRASSVYGINDLSVVGDKKTMSLVLRDKRDKESNDYSVILGATNKKFTFNFSMENLLIIPGSYDVSVYSTSGAKFHNKKYNVSYYIQMSDDSTFEK